MATSKAKSPKPKAIGTKSVKVAEPTPEEILKAKKATAKKAGPKSSRAKAETKTSSSVAKAEKTVKAEAQPTRSPLAGRGKRYRQAYEAIDKTKEYQMGEAVALLPKTSFTKFEASVELHINLGVDPKAADQMVRGTVTLPHGSGKSQRVAALVPADKQAAAKAAGADVVGHENLLEDIGKGKFDFDILVSTPDMMAELGRHAKELGPRGLMPNPKSGTVTKNLAKAVKELKAGRVEFRMDPAGILHQVVGKLSFKPTQLGENIKALLKAVGQARPAGAKGTFIQRIWLTTSMGPSFKLDRATLKSSE